MERSARQRTAAILLAIFAQGSFVALCVLPRGRQAGKEVETAGLVFVLPLELTAVSSPRPQDSKRTSGVAIAPVASPGPAAETIERSDLPAPRLDNGIEPEKPQVPRVDWYQGLAVALQESARKLAAEEKGNPLDSRPDLLVLPKAPPQPAVRVDRLANGDLITRHRLTDDLEMVCEHIQKPLSAHFDVTWNRLPFCSTYRTRTGLEGIDSVKPGYISKPVPKPRPVKVAAKEDYPTDALP